MKKVSAGILLHTPSGYLQCHPFGRKFDEHCFDIPKGEMEPNEADPFDTALRELKEETGLELKTEDIKHICEFGQRRYRYDKDLYLFLVELDWTPDTGEMKCTSMWEDENGEQHPEMDGYRYSETLDGYFRNLEKCLGKCLDDLEKYNKRF